MNRETYTPTELEDDELRFEIYGSHRAKRLGFVHAVSILTTATFLGFIYYLLPRGDIIKRVILPSDFLPANFIQIVTVLFAIWCLFFAALRVLEFRREGSIVESKELHNVVLEARHHGPADAVSALKRLPPRFKGIAYFRLLGILEAQNDGVPFDVLYQACKDRWQLESERLAGEYSLANVLIWAMPILGFIGTVVGISMAVGNFAAFLAVSGNEVDIGLIKVRLSEVANGLAFAFDTTLLGLVGSLAGMLGTSLASSREAEFLSRADAMTLKFLTDGQNVRKSAIR